MNKHMQKYPPRPVINDNIRREAAKNWVQENIPHDDEEVKEALQELLVANASLGDDGFELGKKVENETTITVDFQLCEALDNFSSCLLRVYRMAEKAWVENNHIEPPYPVGTHIYYSSGFSKQRGVITAVYEYAPAKYLIKDDDACEGTNFIISFEDVEAVREEL